MKVILTENVYKLGEVGDIVQVKGGYGRNYLIPQGKAILALKSRKTQLEHHERVLKKKRDAGIKFLQEQASKLEGSQWVFVKKVGAQNKLFGTVTTSEIHAQLKEAGYDVDRRCIKLLSEIKQIGTYQAEISYPSQIRVTIDICVRGDEQTHSESVQSSLENSPSHSEVPFYDETLDEGEDENIS